MSDLSHPRRTVDEGDARRLERGPAVDTVTLVLDGTPTFDEYRRALERLQIILRGLGSDAGGGVEWIIEDLQRSSARTTLRGQAENMDVVDQVATEYVRLGQDYAAGDLSAYRPAVQTAIRELGEIVNGHVTGVRLETAEDDVELPVSPAAPRTTGATAAYGGIEGRIQTLSSRRGLHFTLYDLLHDRGISCYLHADQQDLIDGMWDRLATVEGLVKRDDLGRPMTIRQIHRIAPIEPVGDDAWRSALGALAQHDLPPSEEAIRALRDAE